MIKTIVDLIFPPLCAHCLESSPTPLLCPDCWTQCKSPDPIGRCRHCFEEVEEEGLCSRCVKKPDFFFARANAFEPDGAARWLVANHSEDLAGFVLHQWLQLEWPTPDFIVSLPYRVPRKIGKQMAEWLGVEYSSPFEGWSRNLIAEVLPEGATLLLIDHGLPIEVLKRYEKEMIEAFPKKCFLLSLFPYALADLDSYFSYRPLL